MTHTMCSEKEVISSGLFNAEWYAARYPDVLASGLSPIEHFIRIGVMLNRDPGPRFSARFYIDSTPQAGAAPRYAFVEYLRAGMPAGAGVPPAVAGNNIGTLSLRVTNVRVANFQLYLRGWIVDRDRPGLPLRLDCEIGNEIRQRFIARGLPKPDEAGQAPVGASYFETTLELFESETDAEVSLRVTGTDIRFPVSLLDVSEAAEMPETAETVEPPRPVEASDNVIGSVEAANASGVSGWALYAGMPNVEAPDLILHLDGEPYAQTKGTRFRGDVQRVHGGDGHCAFLFEVAPNLLTGAALGVHIAPAVGQNKINNKIKQIDVPGLNFPALTAPKPRVVAPQTDLPRGKKISIIMLNRNGAGILRDMLQSAEAVGELTAYEWIVVDHLSEDESETVCNEARARGFDIRFVNRKGNFSFSESNNYGAQLATGDILLFANNDLIFREPVAERIIDGLHDSRVGLLGAKLYDYLDSEAWQDRLPIQHLGVYMKPAVENGWLRPYESRLTAETPDIPGALISQPAVTGAFFAMRREDFERVGGFDEGYSYGLEDVDLCFKVLAQLSKEVVCDNGIGVVHHRGFSRGKDTNAVIRRRRNNDLFNKSWGSWLRRNIRRDLLTRPGYWTGARPVIGFIVTDAGDNTSAGEYYTAHELGRAMQKIAPAHLRFLVEDEWEDLSGIDVLIVMVNRFNITKVKKLNPFLVTVNWTRQWFDRWADDPTIHAYDHVWASSQRAADYLVERIGRSVDVVPIASNSEVFAAGTRQPEYGCDWCFTGSYFNLARDIQFQLDPQAIRGKGIVFGHHWEGTPFESISAGPVPYSKMPDVYASTRIVIDDANIATKPWGSCNSRVFDAMAAGCLLITNGDLGVRELFGDLVPTFHDRESLTRTINYWLDHEDERRERVALLQSLVAKEHSYDVRARKVMGLLSGRPAPMRIAIKCAAKFAERAQWGDFHFAESLAAALRRTGAVVRVDCREQWYGGVADTDDAVIVLRGLVPCKLKTHQKNIMWLISHPDDLPLSELQQYDQVYVASEPHAKTLAAQCDVPVGFLPQCTDTERFRFIPELVNSHPDRVLFVGNSRGHFRDSIRWSVEHGLNIDIYGGGWEPFITDSRLKGSVVPNRVLGELYASSRLVLCDHWADMRDKGYISNRVFDVLAVGGRLVVDEVAGMADLLPSGYEVFRDGVELAEIVNRPAKADMDQRAKLAAWVKEHHSFDARARVLADRCAELCSETERDAVAQTA